MTKQKTKVTNELLTARSLALYELDQFIHYIHTVDCDLKPSEATALAAFYLHYLQNLFEENSELLGNLKARASQIKLKRNRRN